MHKLKYKIRNNQRMILFLVGLMMTGIIAGTIFVILLSPKDQTTLINYIQNFLSNMGTKQYQKTDTLFHSLTGNFFYITTIWLLGISVIGIPIILFLFFLKSFLLGFSISSFILKDGIKGCLLAFVTLFPHSIINMGISIFLLLYSLTLSFKISKAVLKKETFDFKKIIKTYVNVLIICLIGVFCSSLIEIYLTPFLLKLLLPILK